MLAKEKLDKKEGKEKRKTHTKPTKKTNLNANHAGTGKLFVMIVHNSYRSISVVYGYRHFVMT